MAHTSARALEFDSMREILRAYAFSPLGQAKIAALAPSGDGAWIERQQQLTAEIREYLRVGARFEFSGLLDPTALVEKAHIEGAALDTAEIRDIVLVVDRADEWRHIAQQPPSQMKLEFAAVAELSSALADFTEFLRFFRNKILPDGTLDDRASPSWRASAARSSGRSGRSRNRCAPTYGAWPRAARCRTSSSPSAGSALSSQ